jgi:long-chain acyl-CoA synthetase
MIRLEQLPMYPSVHAAKNPEKPAYIMASTGQVISYGELNERSIQVSRLFRSLGLKVGDHVAILLENHPWFHIIGFGAHRAGLYFTPISSRLTASEVDYIVGDCTAGAFITQHAKSEVAEELTGLMPGVPAAARFMLDGSIAGFRSFEEAVLAQSTMPLEDETSGNEMLYSSGTTGRPKGILRPLSGEPITAPNRIRCRRAGSTRTPSTSRLPRCIMPRRCGYNRLGVHGCRRHRRGHGEVRCRTGAAVDRKYRVTTASGCRRCSCAC